MQPTLLVMAAGLGSRYGSLKQIDQFGPSGETIIDYSVFDAVRAGFKKVVFVIRESIEAEFKQLFFDRFGDTIQVEYALQELDVLPKGYELPAGREKPWGTGHAVWVASSKIQEPFAVINADDFYGRHSFQVIADFLTSTSTEQAMVGYPLKNTLSKHGYVSRGICTINQQAHLLDVTEHTNIYIQEDGDVVSENDEGIIRLTGEEIVSMNLMGFTPDVFDQFEESFKAFLDEHISQPKKEFYLPSVVNDLIYKQGAKMKVLPTHDHWFGVTYQQDKKVAQQNLARLVDQGEYPENLWSK